MIEQVIKRPLLCATLISCGVCFACSFFSLVGMLTIAVCVVFGTLLVLPFNTKLKSTVLLSGVLSLVIILSFCVHYFISNAPAKNTLGKTLAVNAVVVSAEQDSAEVICYDKTSYFKAKIYFDSDLQLVPGNKIKGELEFKDTFYSSGNNGVKVYANAYVDKLSVQSPGKYSIFNAIHNLRQNIIDIMPFKSQTKAFLKAMILGDKSDVSGVLLNMISTVGLSHLLAVSGMHLIFSVILIDFLMSLFSIGYKPRACVAIVSIALFTVISGFAISCVRAAIMLTIFYIGRISEKFPDSLTSLFLSAYIILFFTPYNVTSTSFLLSVFATVGLIVISPCFNVFIKFNTKNKILNKLFYFIAGIFIMSLSASLACVAVTAVIFNGISIVSPIVNVLVIFPVQALFYIGVFGIIFGVVTPLAPLFSYLGDAMFKVVEYIVTKCYYVKNITFTAGNKLFYPVIALVVVLVVGIIIFNLKSVSKRVVAVYVGSVSMLFLIAFIINNAITANNVTVCFADVGQVNASFVAFDEQAVVIDCGGDFYALNTQLKFNGVKKIKLLAITHTDTDHCSSLEKLLNTYPVEQIVYPEFAKTDNIADALSRTNAKVTVLSNDQTFDIENNITVESFVEKAYNVKYYSNISAVYKVNVYNNSILYTGDMNIYQEHAYFEYKDALDCDILSVAHHGAKKSSQTKFLELCSPEFSVISVGEDNSFGMPAKLIVDRLAGISNVLQTSTSSDIIFKFTPKGYKCLNEY